MKQSLIAASFLACSAFSILAVNSVDAANEAAKPAAASIHDQLNAAKGQKVMLHLRGGRDLEGTVGQVTKDVVELKGLVGRDFFDALVRVEDVSAVVYRVRS